MEEEEHDNDSVRDAPRRKGKKRSVDALPQLSRVVRGQCKDTFLMVGRLVRLEQKPSIAALPPPFLPFFILSFCAHTRRIHYQALKSVSPLVSKAKEQLQSAELQHFPKFDCLLHM